jgi:hypothetical protein
VRFLNPGLQSPQGRIEEEGLAIARQKFARQPAGCSQRPAIIVLLQGIDKYEPKT